jgi:hypothetical protein
MILAHQVTDLETGEALGPGKDGEIRVRGPTITKGTSLYDSL